MSGGLPPATAEVAGEDWAIRVLAMKASFMVDGHGFLDLAPNGPTVGDAFCGHHLDLAAGDVFLNRTLAWENEVTVGYRSESIRATQANLIACPKDSSPRNRWARIPAHLCGGRKRNTRA